MKSALLRTVFLVFVVVASHGVASAQTPDQEIDGITLLPKEKDALKKAQETPIKVGMTISPPFCNHEDGKWDGLSVYLLRSVTEALDIDYTISTYTVSELVDAVSRGEVDVAASALTITADRAEKMTYSHTFHHGGYGVAISRHLNARGSFIERLFSYRFFIAVGSLLLVLFIVGILVWVFERRHSESDFGGGFARGMGSGLWWSAVTMSTVGYGDKSPRTIGGRTVAMVWIFASVILISGFTAAIASSLTVGSMTTAVQEINDLRHLRTGTIRSSSAEEYLHQNGIRTVQFETLEDAISAIEADEIDAVVNDAPILRYMIQEKSTRGVIMSDITFGSIDYAFAFPVDSTLRRPISIEILKTTERTVWPAILRRYLSVVSD